MSLSLESLVYFFLSAHKSDIFTHEFDDWARASRLYSTQSKKKQYVTPVDTGF